MELGEVGLSVGAGVVASVLEATLRHELEMVESLRGWLPALPSATKRTKMNSPTACDRDRAACRPARGGYFGGFRAARRAFAAVSDSRSR